MSHKKNIFKTLVTAALLSAIPAHGSEQTDEQEFIPFEQLQPDQRLLVEEKVKALLEVIKIDFKTVKVGINSDGQIVFKGRTPEEINSLAGNPTCWTM